MPDSAPVPNAIFIRICGNSTCWANFVKNSNSLPPSTAKTAIGQPFIELIEVESTNIYAMEQLQANLAVHGTTYFAHHQTGGRGQHGKIWSAEPGMHIALSVITDCSFLSLSNQFPLSVAMALGVYDLFSRYGGRDTSIKWPNDIYWRDRKAGGILIENQVRGSEWPAAVVGIGLNINQGSFPDHLPNAVSLQQATGNDFNIVTTASELCCCLEHRYQQLRSGAYDDLLAAYNQHLYRRGCSVRLKKNNAAFNCVVESVSRTGELLVNGAVQDSYRFGEVEWILPAR